MKKKLLIAVIGVLGLGSVASADRGDRQRRGGLDREELVVERQAPGGDIGSVGGEIAQAQRHQPGRQPRHRLIQPLE